MTRDEELALLIAEQRADDEAKYVWPERDVVASLDAPLGDATIGDFFGVDEDGNVFSFMPKRELLLGSGHAGQHGLASTYGNHQCRCDACRAAASEKHRDWYRRTRLKPVVKKTCAREGCDTEFESNMPHAKFCSAYCNKKHWDDLRRDRRNALARDRYRGRKLVAA